MMTLLQALRSVPYTPMQQPAVVFLKVPTIDFKSVESKLFINAIPQFLMHSWRDWCFLSVQIWTYWKKKIKINISEAANIVWLEYFSFFFYCFYLSCTAMCDKQLQKILDEIALYCVMLCAIHVTQDIYLQKVKSIKIWDAWRIIRPSHTPIWLVNCCTCFSR